MKKVIFIFTLILTSLILSGCTLNFDYVKSQNKNNNLIEKDIEKQERLSEKDYYDNFLTAYASLLSSDMYMRLIDDFSKNLDKKNEEINKLEKDLEGKQNAKELGKEYMNNLMIESLKETLKNNADIQREFIEIRKKINSENYDKEYIFSKNNECSKNIKSIKEDIDNKLKKYKENDDITFSYHLLDLKSVFYSSKLNSCLYITRMAYGNMGSSVYDEAYSIWNYTNQTLVESFHTVSIINEKLENNTIEAINLNRFILENSNYDINLLKDL